MATERATPEPDEPGSAFVLPVLRFQRAGQYPAADMQAGRHAKALPGAVTLDRLIPCPAATEKAGRLAGHKTLIPRANPIGLC